MTNPTPHGQVPEALIDLIDTYAETRHRCCGIYNARTEAARNAVIEALSGVQALSAAPAGFVPIAAFDRLHAHAESLAARLLAASPTPPAEQAAPKAAPGEQNTAPAEWLEQAYREGWAACRDAETIGEEAEDWAFGNSTANSRVIDSQQAAPKQEAQEPAHPSCKSDMTVNGGALKLALNVLRRAGKTEVADELEKTAQPAPATQQAGDVVAYLDVGASGYLDLGAALSEDALQQLPKGRHALVIAGTYGIDGYVAAPQPSPMAQAAESVPAIQGEMNVQLDIDSNHSAPGQQRDMACSLALGQPVGNGSDQVAGHPSAQEDKLLTVAERNIRSFLRSATFKSESDREAALNCVDVLWEAACATAESVQEDAARYRWLRATTNYVTSNGERIDVRNMPEKWDSAIDAAIAAQGGK